MPKARIKKSEQPPIIDSAGAGMRAAAFFIIVAALTGMLVYVWKTLPKQEVVPTPPPSATSTNPAPEDPQKAACSTAGGTWVECASPCPPGSQACAQVCVAKCVMPESVPVPDKPVRERPAGMTCDATNSICVDPSFASDVLTSPFVATGTAMAFENTVSWKLLDGNGSKLDGSSVTASSPDAGTPGDFQIREFILTIPKTATGTLQVFESSAKDGSPIHVVSIPVRFPKLTQTVKLVCDGQTTMMTISKTRLPIEGTLSALINKWDDVRLRSVALDKGTLTVSLSTSARSNEVQCIMDTAKQFSTVKDVVVLPKY